MKNWEQIASNSIGRDGKASLFKVFATLDRRKYSTLVLWIILRKIFDALRNVAIVSTSDNEDVLRLLDFIMRNINELSYNYYRYGYTAIVPQYDEMGNVTGWAVPDLSTKRTDVNGYPLDEFSRPYQVVAFAESYNFSRLSDFDIVRESLRLIDDYASSDAYLTETMGAFGILCGKNMPISEGDKQTFFERLRKKVGIGRDKVQIVPFNSEVDFKQINLPIKDLALSEKVDREIKILCSYFGIPYDLMAISGQSTYDNQRQAVINFYSSCISPMAEIILSLAKCAVMYSGILVPTRSLTFRVDNVPELATDRPIDVEYKVALLDLRKRMIEEGFDATEIEQEIQRKFY